MDIFTTMITPCKADGSVDYDTARKYVDWYSADRLEAEILEKGV